MNRLIKVALACESPCEIIVSLCIIRCKLQRTFIMLNGLLQLSRAGRSPMGVGLCDMGRLVEGIVEELKAGDPDPTRVFDVGPLPPASGDSSMMRQVWVNLLSNAVKFSARSRPPVIRVRGAAKGAEIVYEVVDNGAGFDVSQAGRLFGVFERLHSQEEYRGTGVGLSIVKRIVDRHGGRVWAEAGPGKGATFWFALPADGKNGEGHLEG